MAADNSPPRIQPIVITAFIAILVLIGLKFAFDSYYVTMFEAEEYRKVGSVAPTELLALHAAEKKTFGAAPVPLDRAIDLVAKGRGEPMPIGPGGDITPQPSTDLAPIIGWASLGKKLPADLADAAAASASASAPAASASGAPVAPAASGSAAAAAPSAKPATSATAVSPPPAHSASPAAPH